MNGFRYLTGVTTMLFNRERCTGCGRCVEVCPHEVFTATNGKADVVDRDACMECGACAKNCPFGAVTVDAGVGCASAVIRGMITGGPPDCSCSGDGSPCC